MLPQSTRGCCSRAVTVNNTGRKSRPIPSRQPHVMECRAVLGHALFPGSYSPLRERVASVCPPLHLEFGS